MSFPQSNKRPVSKTPGRPSSPSGKPVDEVNVLLLGKGYYKDQIFEKDTDGADRLVDTRESTNTITLPFTSLIAGLLLGDTSFYGGITYHAIGEGDSSWDISGIPQPNKLDTQLLDEINRRVPDGITYLKWGRGQALSGSLSTIVDPDRIAPEGVIGRFEPDHFFDGMTVRITAGTNAGEERTVTDYVQSTGTITVTPDFTSPIDLTSQYEFISEVSVSPTNTIEVRTTWDYGDPGDPYNFKYIREQGLFGGTATATANSGLMLDRITHERIYKAPTIKLCRFIVLTFRV